ncbi:MAG: hypothetical protein AAFN40_22835 [Cyanobacteria bacterium J06560_6]
MALSPSGSTRQRRHRHAIDPAIGSDHRLHSRTYWWLFFWFLVALAIRLTYLSSKPAWMDEVATTLFSLGNYSRLIPLNEVISLDAVLRPLQITPGTTAQDVVVNLLREDNHPPGYFVLAHWWIILFHRLIGSTDGYASLWAERAITAFLGALAVPGVHHLAQLCFRQQRLSMICAALVAVSPFAAYLSQEARPYSLAILLNIASLCCFVIATYAVAEGKPLRWRTVFGWIGVNTLGVSVHYFFGLSLLAQGIALLGLLVQQSHRDLSAWRKPNWVKVYIAAVGTFVGSVVWLPILLNFYGSPQSSFLRADAMNWQYFVNPIVQSLAGWLYAIIAPVTNGTSRFTVPIAVISCVVLLLGYVPWAAVVMARSLKFQLKNFHTRLGIQTMFSFFVVANALFFLVCYGLGFDITRGHRYGFVYFPSILILVGGAIAPFWQNQLDSEAANLEKLNLEKLNLEGPFNNFSRVKLPFIPQKINGKAFVGVVIGVAFLGSQVIVFNYSSLKFYKANLFIDYIQAKSTLPVVIGTSTLVTEQPAIVGMEMMSVGWEIQRSYNPNEPTQNWQGSPRFLLVENNVATNNSPEQLLKQQLQKIPEAIDLWMLGGSGEKLQESGSKANLNDENCQVAPEGAGNRGSFSYTHYVCQSR